ncbi:sporulation-control protein [Stackebrandtia endophytica]|uniref:Sporulation-control protein n=1 Tax=Stackebrandtia endophytica TaxID=1496996 RepID=A0A543AR08_9ACTN|nr:sporulation protein [Stackebrandtia endophytica]TQL74966.1 sporulation-control protein [Stackebrandtia endophytica]
MVLRKLTAAFAAGVTVDTVLDRSRAVGGDVVQGEVRLTGGRQTHRVQRVVLDLEAVVENSGLSGPQGFFSYEVGSGFELPANGPVTLPFRLSLPWETPISGIAGEPLPGIRLGVATELALEHALDKGDLDPLTVEPPPAQTAALKAVDSLGFAFHKATIVPGALPQSALPFRQKFEYWPTGEFAQAFRVLRVSFYCDDGGAEVYLEVDKYEGDTSTGGRAGSHIHMSHDEGDVIEALRAELRMLASRPGMFG